MRHSWAAVGALLAAGCGAAPAARLPPVPPAARPTTPSNGPRTAVSEALRAAIRAAVSSPPSAPAAPDPAELAPLPALTRELAPSPASPRGARLPADSVRYTVRKSAGRFRECYRRAPHAEGRIVVELAIASDGTVFLAREAESTLPSLRVRRCVLERAFELQFPRGGGQVLVRYPFLFTPHGASSPDALREADAVAPPPPPGFEAAMLAGVPAPRTEPAPALPPPPKARSARCAVDDPLCDDL